MDRGFDLSELIPYVEGDERWLNYLDGIRDGNVNVDIHLAVFTEPYLSYVLDGLKTIESRFSRVRCAPYKQINEGDIILVKQAGGPVVAITQAAETTFYDFGRDCLESVKLAYANGICADDDFWEMQRTAHFATIIKLVHTRSIEPLHIAKRDRRGWVPLDSRQRSFAF